MQTTVDTAVEALKAELAVIEQKATALSLADLIRQGSTVTEQRVNGWIDNGQSCALGAAYIAAKAHGIV